MKNIDLNPGGIVGALAAGAIVGVVIYMTNDMENGGKFSKNIFVAALFIGGVAGNFLWSLIFKKESK